ncbi:hypothetical protein DOTSEDRAFT_72489 [Dothistroma septosporum NZE10]|uniref:Uncharacterized protein n=1 Tax=Dothistroma septosporum (strain NZE10 / CBS 128990) TaxID=675120 RepID=M2XKU5_DOTSN|nr:hypothetical protein DOTSEDRAFT_72489 [Dothistroma septosporum NZE10]
MSQLLSKRSRSKRRRASRYILNTSKQTARLEIWDERLPRTVWRTRIGSGHPAVLGTCRRAVFRTAERPQCAWTFLGKLEKKSIPSWQAPRMVQSPSHCESHRAACYVQVGTPSHASASTSPQRVIRSKPSFRASTSHHRSHSQYDAV